MNDQNPSFLRPDEVWREIGLRAEQTVVHLGSGAGFFLIPAAKIVGPQGKAIGIDIRPDMLAEVENRANREGLSNNVTTIRANLEKPNTQPPDHSADWVLIANILHQADPAKIFQEATRILKPKGTLAVIEWDTAASPLGPPPQERISKAEAQAMAEDHGFTLGGSFSPSPYHYGMLFSPSVS